MGLKIETEGFQIKVVSKIFAANEIVNMDIDTDGKKSVALISSGTAAYSAQIFPYFMDGSVSASTLASQTAAGITKFDLNGIQKIKVVVKDTSATTTNRIICDVAAG